MDNTVLKILDNIEPLLGGKVSLSDLNCSGTNITYKLYDDLVNGLTVKKLNLQKHLPQLLYVIDSEIKIPNKISNLTRKVKTYISKAGDNISLLQKTIEGLYDCEDLHPDFLKVGIKLDDLMKEGFTSEGFKSFDVRNEHVLNLRKLVKSKSLPWKLATVWVGQLKQCKPPNEDAIRHQWNRLYETKERIHRSKDDLQGFLKDVYKLPSQETHFKSKSTLAGSVTDTESFIFHDPRYRKMSQELMKLYTEFQYISAAMYDLVHENTSLKEKNVKLKDMQHKYEKQKEKINDMKKQIAAYRPENTNRKMKRRELKIDKLTAELQQVNSIKENATREKDEEINLYRGELQELTEKLEKLRSDKSNLQKLKSYYKRKGKDDSTNEPIIELKNKENTVLREQIRSLEQENDMLKEQLNEAIGEHKKISLFNDGKYDDSIRLVYMDLLGMGVSIRNCEKIVQSVLENLLNIQVDRLPKKTLSSILSVEAQILAQAQAAEEMLNHENNTLHLDGTKKNFHEYAGFQISCNDGKSYSLGHPLMATGTAESYIEGTKEIIEQLSSAVCEEEAQERETTANLLISIKNIMTDRHIVNKCYLDKLETLKNELGHPAIPNWDMMSDEQKHEATRLFL